MLLLRVEVAGLALLGARLRNHGHGLLEQLPEVAEAPVGRDELRVLAARVRLLEDALVREGLVRAIGLSNCSVGRLRALLDGTADRALAVRPCVNQVAR